MIQALIVIIIILSYYYNPFLLDNPFEIIYP
jgi:hypothetical protein